MKKNKLLGGLLGLLMVVSGCNSQPANIQFPQDSLPIRIQRFDEALLHKRPAGLLSGYAGH